MRHDLRISGWRFALRPVTDGDAAFIVTLRTQGRNGQFIHPISGRIEDQQAWIAAYEDRPGDYYFIVEESRTGAPVGTVALYDVKDGEAEWGRWVIAEGSMAAVESALLIYRVAFEILGLEAIVCRTVAENHQVVSFHDSSGATRSALLTGHVMLEGVSHDSVEHRVDKELWATMRPRLDMLARRLGAA